MVYYYKNKLPQNNDYVVCEIERIIDDGGYFCKLLEYDNITGFVGLREISHVKRLKKIAGIVNEGDIEVMQVVNIDLSSYDIDLSRKHIPLETKQECMAKYNKYRKIFKFLEYNKDLDIDTTNDCIFDTDNEALMEQIKQKSTRLYKMITNTTNQTCNLVNHSRVVKISQILEIMDVENINNFLNQLQKTFNIDIVTCACKNIEYRITTKQKTTLKYFEKTLLDIQSTQNVLVPDKLNIIDATENETKDTTTSHISGPFVNIGIIGHVSHGKTTLIEVLTGVDTRRYKSEIESNKTIKLGYTNVNITRCTCQSDINYKLKDNNCSCETLQASIVDCPGHNVLLSTMITGTLVMDSCILLVAANEPCPQAQTLEHVRIIENNNNLNHKSHIVVQNKCDLVEKDVCLESKKQINKFVKDTCFESCPIIPISAKQKINIQQIYKFIYNQAKERVKSNSDNDNDNDNRGDFSKGFVVRTFDINKPGSKSVKGLVVGGSILQGQFNKEDSILFVPSLTKTRIVGIKSEKDTLSTATSGGLVALQTTLNPIYHERVIGETFIHVQHYKKSNLLPKNSSITIKCYTYDFIKIKVGESLILNYQGNYMKCMVLDRQKRILKIKLPCSFYVFDDSIIEFNVFNSNRTLIGYAYCQNYGLGKIPKCESSHDTCEDYDNYTMLLDHFFETKQQKLVMRLPIIRFDYRNTYSRVNNFADIAAALDVSSNELGQFVNSELGTRHFSIQSQGVLLLKGKTNEHNICMVLKSFIKQHNCIKCNKFTINKIKRMNVTQLICKDCC